MCVLLCTVVEVSYNYDRTIAMWTLQSISICLIRGHYLEYTTYFNLGFGEIQYGGNLGLLLPVGMLCIQVVTIFPPYVAGDAGMN